MKIDAAVVTALVLVHLLVAAMHGRAHDDLGIVMAAWQSTFINVIIVALPVIGMVLSWTRLAKWGLFAVVVGMVAAFIFGVYHHYMAASPDHISYLPDSTPRVQDTFIWTAGTIAIAEALCATVAAYFLGQRLQSGRWGSVGKY